MSPVARRPPPNRRSRYFTIWSYRRVLFDPYLPRTESRASSKPALRVAGETPHPSGGKVDGGNVGSLAFHE
jgi:hypothetical protein